MNPDASTGKRSILFTNYHDQSRKIYGESELFLNYLPSVHNYEFDGNNQRKCKHSLTALSDNA